MVELVGDGDRRLASSAHIGVALDLVRSFRATSSALVEAQTQILEIANHPDGALRTFRPGHLTGSALVVDSTGSQLVLLFHRKLQRWLQPGGHADGDTNLAAVALKEATEETGISGLRVDLVPLDLDVHEVRPPREDPHLHLDVRFLVVAPEGAQLIANDESEDARWIRFEDLSSEQVDASLLRLADAGRQRLVVAQLAD